MFLSPLAISNHKIPLNNYYKHHAIEIINLSLFLNLRFFLKNGDFLSAFIFSAMSLHILPLSSSQPPSSPTFPNINKDPLYSKPHNKESKNKWP